MQGTPANPSFVAPVAPSLRSAGRQEGQCAWGATPAGPGTPPHVAHFCGGVHAMWALQEGAGLGPITLTIKATSGGTMTQHDSEPMPPCSGNSRSCGVTVVSL